MPPRNRPMRLFAESLCKQHQIVRAIDHGKDQPHPRSKNFPNHDDHVDFKERAYSAVGILIMKNGRYRYTYVEGVGYIKVIPDVDGKPQRVVILKSPLARRYSGLQLIKKDNDLIKEALLKLKSGVDSSIVKQSLSFFAIITYGKCFGESEGRGVKLEFDTVFKDVKEIHRENHKKVIDQRHDYVAHAGLGYEHCPVSATIEINRNIPVSPNIINLNLKIGASIVFMYDIDSQIEGFLALCDVVNGYLKVQLNKIHINLTKETLEIGYIELRKRSFIPDVNNLVIFDTKNS